jgi:hypothetical protein
MAIRSWISNLSNADVIALSAAFVALMSMVAAAWQGWLTRTHNRLSVRPKLDFMSSGILASPVNLVLHNYGLGPAISKEMTLHYNGTEFQLFGVGIPKEVYDEISRSSLKILDSAVGQNSLMAPGDTITLLQFTNTIGNEELNSRTVEIMHRFDPTIVYESMYGETFSLVRVPHVRTPEMKVTAKL